MKIEKIAVLAVSSFATAQDVVRSTRVRRNDDLHAVVYDESLTPGQKALIQSLMSEADVMGRMFSDFVRMSFWAAVQSLNADDPITNGVFDTVHEIDLESSRSWWKDNFLNYGCYCWPDGEERISGFGDPVDDLDRECFDLYQCYKCVSKQPGCEAISWTGSDYGCKFVGVNNTMGENVIDIKCTDSDPCLQSLCECDKEFALQSRALLEVRNPANVNVFAEQCVQGPVHEEKACCGDWPNVSIYSKQVGKCCDSDLKVREVGVGVGFQCDNQTITPGFTDLFRTLTLGQDEESGEHHD